MNNEDSRGHWTKKDKETNKNIILRIIKEREPITYSEIKNLVSFSDPTLSNYLKELKKEKLIEWYEDPKDSRVKRYRLRQENKQKVEAKLLKHESTQFIESLQNPLYAERKEEIEGSTVGVSFFVELDSLNDELRTDVKDLLRRLLDEQFPQMGRDLALESKEILEKAEDSSSYKFAIVQTVYRTKK